MVNENHEKNEKDMILITGEKGFGFIEAILGGGIVIMSVLSLSVVFKEIASSKVRGKFISSISAIESSLTTALLDENMYEDQSVKESLRVGRVPQDWEFAVKGQSFGKDFNFEIQPNSAVAISSKNFQACTDFPSSGCDIQLELRLPPAGAQPAFAYKFKFHTELDQSLLNYYGAGSTTDQGFATEDFSLPIPHEFIYNSLQLACPPGSVGVRGVDRGLGKVNCVSQSSQACPDGTLPKSLFFNADTNSVEFVCSGVAQSVGCPAKYVLEVIDTRSLDSGMVKSAACVYEKARVAAGPTIGPVSAISGKICPDDYRSQSSCYVVNTQITYGQCPDICTAWNTVIDYDVNGVQIGTHQECGSWLTPPPNLPATGRAVLNEDSSGNATCSVYRPTQSCGAYWDAQLMMDVSCTLALPEYVNAQ